MTAACVFHLLVRINITPTAFTQKMPRVTDSYFLISCSDETLAWNVPVKACGSYTGS